MANLRKFVRRLFIDLNFQYFRDFISFYQGGLYSLFCGVMVSSSERDANEHHRSNHHRENYLKVIFLQPRKRKKVRQDFVIAVIKLQ